MSGTARRLFRTFFLGVPLATLASLALLEVLVRILQIAPPLQSHYNDFVPDAVLPFKLRPDSRLSGGSIGGEFSFEHAHNSLGLRDREHAADKPPGVFRILGLGDSFTYGIGAAFDDTYLARLEQQLNRSRPGAFEIIKAGVPRYFPEPERLMLEHYGLPFHPDLVLVGFVPNDVEETYLGLDAVAAHPAYGFLMTKEARMLGSVGIFFYRHWHTFRILWVHAVSDRMWFDPHINPHQLVGKQAAALQGAWSKIKQEYAAMLRISKEHGAAFAVVFIPSKGPPWPEADAAELAGWCRENKVPFINTLPAVRAAAEHETLYWQKDMHCNARGYAVIAEELQRELTELKLLPAGNSWTG